MARYTYAAQDTYASWCSGLYTGLGTVLTQAADTGQIADPSALSYPSPGAYSGYRVYYFNDAAHATAPVYVKVEVGVDTNYYFRVRWTVGRATDGAGTITGSYYNADTFTSSCASGVAAATGYVAGDGSGFVWSMAPGLTRKMFVCVDRFRLGDGTPSASGLFVTRMSGGSQYPVAWSAVRNGGGYGTGFNYFGPGLNAHNPWTAIGTSLEVDGAAPLFPLYFTAPQVGFLKMLAMTSQDVAQGSEFAADTWLGTADVTFKGLGSTVGDPWLGSTTGAPTLSHYYDA